MNDDKPEPIRMDDNEGPVSPARQIVQAGIEAMKLEAKRMGANGDDVQLDVGIALCRLRGGENPRNAALGATAGDDRDVENVEVVEAMMTGLQNFAESSGMQATMTEVPLVPGEPQQPGQPCENCGDPVFASPDPDHDAYHTAREGSAAARLDMRFERLCAGCKQDEQVASEWSNAPLQERWKETADGIFFPNQSESTSNDR